MAFSPPQACGSCSGYLQALLFRAFVLRMISHVLSSLSLFLVRDCTQLCSRDTSTDHLATFWAPFAFFKRAFGFVKTNYPKHLRVIKTP
ncbi:hypothetical protein NFI96_014493 [Prochilodus magdalenae]|nr:hypothetical protein NFI96_014493 [Prochilodus magdalenae]